MRIKGAMTILHKRADFYGLTFRQLIDMYESDGFMNIENETMQHIQAYEVYKRDQGYVWSGVNFETWVKKEAA